MAELLNPHRHHTMTHRLRLLILNRCRTILAALQPPRHLSIASGQRLYKSWRLEAEERRIVNSQVEIMKRCLLPRYAYLRLCRGLWYVFLLACSCLGNERPRAKHDIWNLYYCATWSIITIRADEATRRNLAFARHPNLFLWTSDTN